MVISAPMRAAGTACGGGTRLAAEPVAPEAADEARQSMASQRPVLASRWGETACATRLQAPSQYPNSTPSTDDGALSSPRSRMPREHTRPAVARFPKALKPVRRDVAAAGAGDAAGNAVLCPTVPSRRPRVAGPRADDSSGFDWCCECDLEDLADGVHVDALDGAEEEKRQAASASRSATDSWLGEIVEVEEKGTWYAALIVASHGDGTYFVEYLSIGEDGEYEHVGKRGLEKGDVDFFELNGRPCEGWRPVTDDMTRARYERIVAAGRAEAEAEEAEEAEAEEAEESEEESEEEEGGPLATEAEGLVLHLSKKNPTGYMGVYEKDSGRYEAAVKSGGKQVCLGRYGTAVEAAVVYARAKLVAQPAVKAAAAAAEEEEEEEGGPLATEAEGLALHLSERSATGYMGVYKHGSRYEVRVCGGVKQVLLGSYGTAVEAAVVYARAKLVAQPAVKAAAAAAAEEEEEEGGPLATEAEGLALHLSERSATGYMGVYKHGSRYEAAVKSGGKQVCLGRYGTAVEAAVVYARAKPEAPGALHAEEGKGKKRKPTAQRRGKKQRTVSAVAQWEEAADSDPACAAYSAAARQQELDDDAACAREHAELEEGDGCAGGEEGLGVGGGEGGGGGGDGDGGGGDPPLGVPASAAASVRSANEPWMEPMDEPGASHAGRPPPPVPPRPAPRRPPRPDWASRASGCCCSGELWASRRGCVASAIALTDDEGRQVASLVEDCIAGRARPPSLPPLPLPLWRLNAHPQAWAEYAELVSSYLGGPPAVDRSRITTSTPAHKWHCEQSTATNIHERVADLRFLLLPVTLEICHKKDEHGNRVKDGAGPPCHDWLHAKAAEWKLTIITVDRFLHHDNPRLSLFRPDGDEPCSVELQAPAAPDETGCDSENCLNASGDQDDEYNGDECDELGIPEPVAPISTSKPLRSAAAASRRATRETQTDGVHELFQAAEQAKADHVAAIRAGRGVAGAAARAWEAARVAMEANESRAAGWAGGDCDDGHDWVAEEVVAAAAEEETPESGGDDDSTSEYELKRRARIAEIKRYFDWLSIERICEDVD